MAMFVNYNKRSVKLPPGCKDLIDLLMPSNQRKLQGTIWDAQPAKTGGHDNSVRRFILLILWQAHKECATELIIGVPSADGAGTTIRYKVGDAWYDMSPFPSQIRPSVVSELARMAVLSQDERFPKQGVLEQVIANTPLRWSVLMTTVEAECRLTRIAE